MKIYFTWSLNADLSWCQRKFENTSRSKFFGSNSIFKGSIDLKNATNLIPPGLQMFSDGSTNLKNAL